MFKVQFKFMIIVCCCDVYLAICFFQKPASKPRNVECPLDKDELGKCETFDVLEYTKINVEGLIRLNLVVCMQSNILHVFYFLSGSKTWGFLHTMAAYYPDSPTSQQKNDMKAFFNSFSQFYPCEVCAKDFQKE